MEVEEATPQIGYKDVIYMQQAELDKVRTKVHDMATEITVLKLDIVKIIDKMGVRQPCDLHVNSMKELNDGVTRIEIINAATSGKVDGFISSVNRLLEKLETDVYKTGGLITIADGNKKQISLQWGIISVIFIGFIGGLALHLWKH